MTTLPVIQVQVCGACDDLTGIRKECDGEESVEAYCNKYEQELESEEDDTGSYAFKCYRCKKGSVQ